MLTRLATIVLLAAFATPSPAQQPTFRSQVELIELPVLVTDRTGRFVQGLTVDDFEVREDGKRQPIQTFAVVDLPFESFSSEDVEARTDVATNAHAAGRLYLIVLDDLHINARNTSAVRQLVREFLTRHVYRNDLVAIVRTGGNAEGVRELTNDRARLLESLDSFAGRKLPQPPRDCPDPLDLERSHNVRAVADVLAAMTEYLARVRGRKTSLLFVSEGIDYDIYDMMGDSQTEAEAVTRQIDDAIAAAQRNGVVIYALDPRKLFPRTEDEEPDPVVPCRPIDTRGRDVSGRIALGRMSPMNSAPSTERARRSLQSLTHIAKETGGFAVTDRNGIDEAFTRIVQENTQYYVLGYEAPPGEKGRRFRRLEVKVRRPDVVVRARPGYRPARGEDRDPGPPLSGSGAPSRDLAAALESPAR